MAIQLDEETRKKIKEGAARALPSSSRTNKVVTIPQEQSVRTITTESNKQTQQPYQSIQTVNVNNLSRMSASQQLMSKQDPFTTPQRSSKDYLAKIGEIAQTDPQRAQTLYAKYQTLTQDPTSALYNPYQSPTNKAVYEIAKLGVDVSSGIDADWIARNKGLLAGARYTTTGMTPAAPTTKSSAAENAAYWYYQIAKNEDKTQRAELEWNALKEEIAFRANWSARNYSDQEILSMIDWKKYPTLAEMDESKSMGVPMSFNRAIGYTQDNLYGAIWAARNASESSDNDTVNSIRYAKGMGIMYDIDEDARSLRDATSPNYNPYKAGTTLDDAAAYFGVYEFNQEWLNENLWMRNSTDATMRNMYDKVYAAEMNTQQAEQELQSLRDYLKNDIYPYTKDPDVILDGLFDDYKTLQKMDESLKNGKLLATTRSIDFSRKAIEDEINEYCSRKHASIFED